VDGRAHGEARRQVAPCVKVTRPGMQALREAKQAAEQMWQGLDPRLEKIR
jgi:hypothetical protein